MVGQVGSVMGQINSIRDSLKILPELVAQIAALRKGNEPGDVAEPSRNKASELGFQEEFRAQERRLMGTALQGVCGR